MAGTCDICGNKTGFLNQFRCQDGILCKDCYKIVSNHYSSTIAGSSLTELKKIHARNSRPIELGEDGFCITKKIGTFLLLDQKNHKFCLLSNQQITGTYTRPEIFRFEQLERYELLSEPALTFDQLAALPASKNVKENSALQDSPPAADRISDIFHSAAVRSRGAFCVSQNEISCDTRKTVIRKLAVQLHLTNGLSREILIIPSPVRVSSLAFRQGLKSAEEIMNAFKTQT